MKKDKKALELIYDPDEYLCTWSVPDSKGAWHTLSGSVEAQANRPPRGQIYGEVPLRETPTAPGQTSFAFPQRNELPVLRASLANGGTLILLDATITYLLPNYGVVSGSAALLSRGDGLFHSMKAATKPPEQSTPRVTGARIQITALDAVVGTVPISEVALPSSSGASKREWTARANPDAHVEWAAEGATLRVAYDGRARALDAFEFRLRFSPVATLQLTDGLTLRELVDDYVEPLRRLVAIATGQPQDLTYLAVELDEEKGRFQVFGTAITQEPYESSSNAVNDVSSAVKAHSDDLSLLDFITRWRALESEHHPLVETYGSMLHADDQHPRSRFLLLIQALEGMHGAETRDQYEERTERHVDRRTAVLEKLQALAAEGTPAEDSRTEVLSASDRSFISKFLMKRPMSNLDGALTAMARSLPVNGMEALASTNLVKGLLASERANSAPEALRVVRNDLAHGNRGYPADDLDDVVTVLERIVRGHALRLLGCTDLVVSRVFDQN